MNSTREELLFALAVTKTVAERSVWLDRECGEDKALRARLDALLAAHEQLATELELANAWRDEFHESPASPSSSQGLTELDPPRDAPDEAVGQTLGCYKLLEQIGEGGCDVVYVAELLRPPQFLPIINNTHSPYKP